jgi:hypothetical protein
MKLRAGQNFDTLRFDNYPDKKSSNKDHVAKDLESIDMATMEIREPDRNIGCVCLDHDHFDFV